MAMSVLSRSTGITIIDQLLSGAKSNLTSHDVSAGKICISDDLDEINRIDAHCHVEAKRLHVLVEEFVRKRLSGLSPNDFQGDDRNSQYERAVKAENDLIVAAKLISHINPHGLLAKFADSGASSVSREGLGSLMSNLEMGVSRSNVIDADRCRNKLLKALAQAIRKCPPSPGARCSAAIKYGAQIRRIVFIAANQPRTFLQRFQQFVAETNDIAKGVVEEAYGHSSDFKEIEVSDEEFDDSPTVGNVIHAASSVSGILQQIDADPPETSTPMEARLASYDATADLTCEASGRLLASLTGAGDSAVGRGAEQPGSSSAAIVNPGDDEQVTGDPQTESETMRDNSPETEAVVDRVRDATALASLRWRERQRPFRSNPQSSDDQALLPNRRLLRRLQLSSKLSTTRTMSIVPKVKHGVERGSNIMASTASPTT